MKLIKKRNKLSYSHCKNDSFLHNIGSSFYSVQPVSSGRFRTDLVQIWSNQAASIYLSLAPQLVCSGLYSAGNFLFSLFFFWEGGRPITTMRVFFFCFFCVLISSYRMFQRFVVVSLLPFLKFQFS